MLLDISIIPQTSEELFYFVTKRIPYYAGSGVSQTPIIPFREKGVILSTRQGP